MVTPTNNVRDGRAAYRMLEQHCTRTITDLEIETLNAEWDQSSITASVGVTLDSITMFARHLNGLNARRPQLINGQPGRKSEDELTKKLLLSLTPKLCPVLHHEAAKEMHAAPADRASGPAGAGKSALIKIMALVEKGDVAVVAPTHGARRADQAVIDEVFRRGSHVPTPRAAAAAAAVAVGKGQQDARTTDER